MDYKLTTYDVSVYNNRNRQEDFFLSLFIEATEEIKNSNSLEIGEGYPTVNYYEKLKSKLQFDINSEKISDKNKRTISFLSPDNPYNQKELKIDITKSTISGILYGGKIADNEILLKLKEESDENGDIKIERQFEQIENGNKILSEFFFTLYFPLNKNIGKLYILSRTADTNIDGLIKGYFENKIFKNLPYKSTISPFLPNQVKDSIQKHGLVNSLTFINKRYNKEGVELRGLPGTYKFEVKLTSIEKNSHISEFLSKINIFKKNIKIDNVIFEDDDKDFDAKIEFKDAQGKNRSIWINKNREFTPSQYFSAEEVEKEGIYNVERINDIISEQINFIK